MNGSGDAAEQVVRLSLEGTEVVLKLTGTAANNFLVSLLYTQLFQQLFTLADHKNGGRLPVHVHFLMDEFANANALL